MQHKCKNCDREIDFIIETDLEEAVKNPIIRLTCINGEEFFFCDIVCTVVVTLSWLSKLVKVSTNEIKMRMTRLLVDVLKDIGNPVAIVSMRNSKEKEAVN